MKKVGITLPAELYQKISSYAKNKHMLVNEFICVMLEYAVDHDILTVSINLSKEGGSDG